MNKQDFEYDHDDFKKDILKTAFAYQRLSNRFGEVVEHWKELGTDYLSGSIVVDAESTSSRVTGNACGKPFAINLVPLIAHGENYALATVSTNNLLDGEPVELCQFLISIRCGIWSTEGEELIDADDDHLGFKLLVAISRKLLKHPLQG